MSGDAPDRVGSTDGEIWLARSFVGFSPMGSHLATTLARRMVRRATLGAATTLLRARTWLIVWCVRCIASRFARRLMVAQPVSLLAPLSSQSPAAGGRIWRRGDDAPVPQPKSSTASRRGLPPPPAMAASNGHAHVDDAPPPVDEVPAPSVADVDACRCAAWHALGDLSSHTFAHRHLALPPDFVAYLLEDGLSLAADSQAMPARIRPDIAEQMESAFTLSDEEDDAGVADARVVSDSGGMSFEQLRATLGGGGGGSGSSDGESSDGERATPVPAWPPCGTSPSWRTR